MAQLGNTIINGNLVISGTLTAAEITGNSESATRATQDASGNVITAYYAHSLTIANSVLTLKNAAGGTLSTVTISTADTLQAITANGATTSYAIDITNTTASSSTTTGALKVTGGIGAQGEIWGNKVHSAVWNDYAEYRECNGYISPGDVVTELGDGTLELSYKRLLPASWVVSDTFGFVTGETEKAQTPVATCGRVLVKMLENRKDCKVGDCVCSAAGGHASLMSREEIYNYPEAIIGIICSVPTEDVCEYGVPINNRVWIKVK